MPYLLETQQLSDLKTFERRVRAFSPMGVFGVLALGIGLLLLIVNIFQTKEAVDRYSGLGSGFWDLFFVTQTARGFSLQLAVVVWGGVLLPLVGIGLLIASRFSRASFMAKLHQEYLNGGYVAQWMDLGFKLVRRQGRSCARMPVGVRTMPNQSDQEIAQMVSYLSQRGSQIGLRDSMALGSKFGGASTGVAPVSAIFPEVTALNLLSFKTKSPGAVIFHKNGSINVYPLKKEA